MRDGEGEGAPKPTRRKPPEVRFARYAIFGVGREYRLSALALWLLESLCHLADYKTRSYATTLGQLAEDTRIDKDAIPKVLKALCDAGLVRVINPFGPHKSGEVEILCWDRLFVGSGDARTSEKPEFGPTSEPPKNRSLTDKGTSGQSPVNLRSVSGKPEFHQPKQAPVREQAYKEEEVRGELIRVQNREVEPRSDFQKIDAASSNDKIAVPLKLGDLSVDQRDALSAQQREAIARGEVAYDDFACPQCGEFFRRCSCPF